MYAEAVKTGGKYLRQLIMTAEKVSAELIKTAGKNHSILKQRLAGEIEKRCFLNENHSCKNRSDTLNKFDVPRSTYYRWKRKEGIEDEK